MCNHRRKNKNCNFCVINDKFCTENIINANRVSINDGNNNLSREQGNICGILMFFNEEKKNIYDKSPEVTIPNYPFTMFVWNTISTHSVLHFCEISLHMYTFVFKFKRSSKSVEKLMRKTSKKFLQLRLCSHNRTLSQGKWIFIAAKECCVWQNAILFGLNQWIFYSMQKSLS